MFGYNIYISKTDIFKADNKYSQAFREQIWFEGNNHDSINTLKDTHRQSYDSQFNSADDDEYFDEIMIEVLLCQQFYNR